MTRASTAAADLVPAILQGLSASLAVGLGATALACVVGVAVAVPAAYFGGRIRAFVMHIVDVELGFPAILIAIVVMAALGRGAGHVIAALVVVQWAHCARSVQGAARVATSGAYVEAARGVALSPSRIMLRHLLPNCLPTLLVTALGQLAAAIALETTLSFLGLGLPPGEPSLGLLIAAGFRELATGGYWSSVLAGVALVLTLLGLHLAADALRAALPSREKP